MVTYTCDRCGNIFPKLWKLRRHQERKFSCKPAPNPQLPDPEPNHEAGPGPTTQAHREAQITETTSQQAITQDQEKIYTPEENFQSIYETENGVKEKELPSGDIKFLKKRPDTERQHKSLDAVTF
ncbi:1417_t:CDS:1 [Racocetra fulgida]|uniref:1417_t:CDS:1 n=1 Tax=Racocetra fulgida TaxID=60492 RepID=A0A9N9D6Z0_9GLOM|nr:1417_t:CDS:1 [Racocetra fulgida]